MLSVRGIESMRKWQPAIYGSAVGCTLGMYLLATTSGGGIPPFIIHWLRPVVEGEYTSLNSGERGPGGMLFALFVVILFWAASGAGLGYGVGRIVALMRKPRA